MKKRSKYILFIIFVSLCVVGFLCGIVLVVRKIRVEGLHVYYEDIRSFSSNNRYEGKLNYSDEPIVIIYDKKTQRSKSFKRESIYNSIVLGRDYFFLYSEPIGGEKTKIARYTYDGKEDKVLELDDEAEVSCRNGILFIGCWRDRLEDIWWADFYMKGFCTNYYIEEKNFGEEFKWLDTTKKTVEVNGVTLYYHNRGYFCTEPDIGDYKGTVSFAGDIYLFNSSSLSPLTYEHVNMLKERFHFTEDSKIALYEYQDGYDIYGCCNLMDELINPLPIKDYNVNKSWCYRINGKTKELEVLEEREKALILYCTEEDTIYCKDKVVYCENRRTAKRKKIIKNRLGMSLTFDHGYLLCEEYNPEASGDENKMYVMIE